MSGLKTTSKVKNEDQHGRGCCNAPSRNRKKSSQTKPEFMSIFPCDKKLHVYNLNESAYQKTNDFLRPSTRKEEHTKANQKSSKFKKAQFNIFAASDGSAQFKYKKHVGSRQKNCSYVSTIGENVWTDSHSNAFERKRSNVTIKKGETLSFENFLAFQKNRCPLSQQSKNENAKRLSEKKKKLRQAEVEDANRNIKKSTLTPKETETTNFNCCEHQKLRLPTGKHRYATTVVPLLSPEQLVMRESIEKVRKWIKTLPNNFDAIYSVSPPTTKYC